MKKKIICLVLIFILSNTIFVSCGKKDIRENETTTIKSIETETHKMVEKETTQKESTIEKNTTEQEVTEERITTEITSTTEQEIITEQQATTKTPTTTEYTTNYQEQTTTYDPLWDDPWARAERDNPNFYKYKLGNKFVYNDNGSANLKETTIIYDPNNEDWNNQMFKFVYSINDDRIQYYLSKNYCVTFGAIREYLDIDYSHWDIRDYKIYISEWPNFELNLVGEDYFVYSFDDNFELVLELDNSKKLPSYSHENDPYYYKKDTVSFVYNEDGTPNIKETVLGKNADYDKVYEFVQNIKEIQELTNKYLEMYSTYHSTFSDRIFENYYDIRDYEYGISSTGEDSDWVYYYWDENFNFVQKQ